MTTKTITTDRPITLHGLCQVPDSFCDGIELCSILYQNLVPEKSGTRLTDTRANFWYQFLVPVSVACVTGLMHRKSSLFLSIFTSQSNMHFTEKIM